jgi:hypothetical protein
MLSPLSARLDPPAVRVGWLKMMLQVFRRHDRGGLYAEMITLTERLIADAERERVAGLAPVPAPPGHGEGEHR